MSRDSRVVFSSHSPCQCQIDHAATKLLSTIALATGRRAFTDGCNHQTSKRGGNLQAFSCHELSFMMRTDLRDQ